MNKHRINSSKKLIGNSNKSRLKTFSSCSKLEEELFEFSLILYDIHSHEKQYSSQMPIPFLGDTQSNITPSRLLNFYILNRFREKLIKLIQLFQKQKEDFNFAPKDIFKGLRIYANRLRSKVKDHIRGERRLLTSPLEGFREDKIYNLSIRTCNTFSRGEMKEEIKHSRGEGINMIFKLREEDREASFNIILKMRNFLFKFRYFIGGRRGKLRDSLSIFLVRLRRSKINLRKSINDRGINDNRRDTFLREEREEVNVVDRSRLHTNKERGEISFFLHNYTGLRAQPTYLNLRKQRTNSQSGLESPGKNSSSCFLFSILFFPYTLVYQNYW